MILRTPDGKELRVELAVLAAASPVFQGMATLPPPTTTDGEDTKDGCPVISMQESVHTISVLLEVIHPGRAFEWKRSSSIWLQTVHDVLLAADKYQMVKVAPFFELYLDDVRNFDREDQTFCLFAMAVKFNMRTLTQSVAQALLAFPPLYYLDSVPPELADVSAMAYHQLLKYREKCFEILFPSRGRRPRGSDWVSGLYWDNWRRNWNFSSPGPCWDRCHRCAPESRTLPKWFIAHIERIEDAFHREVTAQRLLKSDLLETTIKSLPPLSLSQPVCECQQKAPALLIYLAECQVSTFQQGLSKVSYYIPLF